MAILLITYDLHQSDKDCEEVIKLIKATALAWAKLSESSYAIRTDESPKEIMERFQPLMSKLNRIFVVSLAGPYAGFGSDHVNRWLKDALPE